MLSYDASGVLMTSSEFKRLLLITVNFSNHVCFDDCGNDVTKIKPSGDNRDKNVYGDEL